MDITVAICTHDRSRLLAQTLDRLAAMRPPAGVAWDVLVVNNACSDDTDDVIASFGGRLLLRRSFEPVPGLSNARNRAVEDSTGDWIVWTDDDVLVDPEWLSGYATAFSRHGDGAVFGGPVEPAFMEPVPRWLSSGWRVVADAYALRNLGEDEVPLSETSVPYGANFAVRRDVQAGFPYDPSLGRAPGVHRGGEEVAVIRAILASGRSGWWVPQARVGHSVTRDRQTTGYLRRHFSAQGALAAGQVFAGGARRPPHTLFGRPLWWLRRAAALELRYRLLRVSAPPAVWLEALVRSSYVWGQLDGATTGKRRLGR